jgi:hypothetical protein
VNSPPAGSQFVFDASGLMGFNMLVSPERIEQAIQMLQALFSERVLR